jgi:hypothetical protein
MNEECQHTNGQSIGYVKPTENNYRKYQILRDAAKAHGVRIWEVFLCDGCGKLIDENDYKPLNNADIAAWISDLMIVQRSKISEFIESLE